MGFGCRIPHYWFMTIRRFSKTLKKDSAPTGRRPKPPPGRFSKTRRSAPTATLISTIPVRVAAGRVQASPVPVTIPMLLIEDNRLLRDGLTAMLGAQGLKVVAAARSGRDALRQVGRLKPQLVLLDGSLGDREGLRLVAAVQKAVPGIRIIVMHLLATHEDVAAYVKAGVAGFLMKDAGVAELIDTIRRVADGACVLPPLMTGSLFTHVAEHAVARGKRGLKAAVRMTRRERQVTELIADGLSNRDIAGRLGIAAHTVKSHVHNILEKLALHTRLEVAAFAHQRGKA